MKEEIHNELQELSPLLATLHQKKQDIAPPDGYLDSFEEGLLERLASEQGVVEKPQLFVWRKWAIPMGIAASLLLLVGAVWIFNNQEAVPNQEALAMNLTDSEVESYILENITEFESENLSQFVELQEEVLWDDAPTEVLDELSLEELEELL